MNLTSTLLDQAYDGIGGREAATSNAREVLPLLRGRELMLSRMYGADDWRVLLVRLERVSALMLHTRVHPQGYALFTEYTH